MFLHQGYPPRGVSACLPGRPEGPQQGSVGTFSLCCRVSCVLLDPVLFPNLALLSTGSWATRTSCFSAEAFHLDGVEEFHTDRNSSCFYTEKIHPENQSQQRLDQDTRPLLAPFEGRDGQVPMQEFLQQPEGQHDITRIQGSQNKKN